MPADFMLQLKPYLPWLAAAAMAFAIYSHRADLAWLLGMLKGLRLPAMLTTKGESVPSVAAEVAALEVLDKRGVRLKNKEYQTAMLALKKEFFIDHSTEGA